MCILNVNNCIAVLNFSDNLIRDPDVYIVFQKKCCYFLSDWPIAKRAPFDAHFPLNHFGSNVSFTFMVSVQVMDTV